jgi:hypothetical protein
MVREVADVRFHNGSDDPEVHANARRICLAVNATAGLSDTALESDVIAVVREALEAATSEIIADRDSLYDSVTDSKGNIVDEIDGLGLGELDALVDKCRAALALLATEGDDKS